MQDFFILIYKHKFIHDQIIEVFPSKDSVKNYLILKYVDDDSVFNKIDYLIASGESFAHNLIIRASIILLEFMPLRVKRNLNQIIRFIS